MATEALSRRVAGSEHPAWSLVGFVVLCEVAGALGALATDPSFYREIRTPSWAPPAWLFAPVWLTLYAMMGVAASLVWRSAVGENRRRALSWFVVQLALNVVWTPVFFGLHSIGGGLIVIAALWVAIVGTLLAIRKVSAIAALLLVPYLLWVTFAMALNASLYSLN